MGLNEKLIMKTMCVCYFIQVLIIKSSICLNWKTAQP